MRHSKWISSFAIGFLLTVIVVLQALAQATSTPEERTRWVEITHTLETNPLDESVNKDGDWP